MKIEFRAHYWPATPHLREIKIFIDGQNIYSTFLNQGQIADLANELRYIDPELMKIANAIKD